MLRKMCNKGVVMNRGKIACVGGPEEALSFYHAESEESRQGAVRGRLERRHRQTPGPNLLTTISGFERDP